ncbi:GNAT family N-acetyltransferase [Ruminiclostridium herbifermentans]|uniref:GNAT family N-acetyltransferase n=1 Tax=Ruminiclostridium herbifermentans TaxID=2488810 RepID=A0A4U7JH68_9FIRM|nr:GNAT family protein [Ruminiclostridium herbifermentans]QNU67450.1 GNAT family N-acetyltransferase [Ruminiclostridium herbifermentans]
MKFESQRLKCRYFTELDYQLFCSIFSNEQVMKYAWIDKIENEVGMREFFEGFLNHDDRINRNNSYAYAVFLREEDIFIGFADIVIHSLNSNGGCGEIGYFLLPQYWGKGYATELAHSLINFGFTRLGLHKISARCNSNNLKSENIMKKVGMTKEGELRKVRYKNGVWDDEKHYGILIDEWKE